ncbi:MAG: hypothetical protein EZS28_020821 [Streblomastix strix]|uniref:Protein kinase domain-containing protein n=1 Tax=Streblomastix strix TaxID=222440 RepID=A0A5J4VM12_9EUKA|nr:MAG: hypothetical protein EZS28_020821 [Streblomastix strix]
MEDIQLLSSCGIDLIKIQGHGAYGTVYLSYNNELGVIVAKVMRIEKFDEREWDAAGKLNQPEFRCPFIMKQDKESFKRDLQSTVKTNPYESFLEGIAVAHSAEFIHGNIKAENIMMHSSNGSTKVKIADFGLAKVDASKQMGVTACGIPLNMVDIWSVGVVLFQLRTHEYPIQAGSILELTKKMASGKIIRPTSIQDDQLWNLLTKLLEFDPIKRISAAEALRHPYFTSPRATMRQALKQNDLHKTKFLNVYVEQEEQNILKAKQQQRLQQYVQSEEHKSIPPVQYLSIPTPVKFNIHYPDQHKMPTLIPQYPPNPILLKSNSLSNDSTPLSDQSPVSNNQQLNRSHSVSFPHQPSSPISRSPSHTPLSSCY